MEKVKVRKQANEPEQPDDTQNYSYEEAFRMIRARYCHEKKKIIFIMYTVRKLRNLAKLKYVFNELSEKFMLSACLLLIKGLLLNKNTIKSLERGDNIFNL